MPRQNVKVEFKDIRNSFKEALEDDDGLYIAYVANVAMLFNDRYGCTDHKLRNKMAKDTLKVIFDVEPRQTVADGE